MKPLLALALLTFAAPLAAADAPLSLPGVADEETTISSGGISQYHAGNGDVLFVLDRAGRWYRIALNDGCLKGTDYIGSLSFDYDDSFRRIDRFTRVLIAPDAGAMRLTCRIDSIRRSEAPPQVDSRSRVTLD